MEDCALRMGVTQPAWSEWENDKVGNPRRRTILKIAAALEESPTDFLLAAGFAPGRMEPDEEITRLLYSLAPDKRDLAVRLFRSTVQAIAAGPD